MRRKTSEKLRELTEHNEGILPTIVISEIVRATCQKRGKKEANIRYLALVGSKLQIQNLDQNIAKEAGLLKCRYRNVPTGDCIIAATATINKAQVLSDDPHYDTIKETKRTWI